MDKENELQNKQGQLERDLEDIRLKIKLEKDKLSDIEGQFANKFNAKLLSLENQLEGKNLILNSRDKEK